MNVFKALVVAERKQKTPLTLVDFDPPVLKVDEILVSNEAVAQNPVDWKGLDLDFNIPELPWVLGADLAGEVVQIGPGVHGFSIGDRVISFASRITPRHSAFQTHTVASTLRTVKLPNSYSWEEGATIPLGYVTAACGLTGGLDLSYPRGDAIPAEPNGVPVLVWGGSSSVGGSAVQIAKLNGYTVIATASPRNFEYVKSLGADLVFDYNDPDVVSKVRHAAGPNLSFVYDAISEHGTTKLGAESITSTSGGKVVTVLEVNPEIGKPYKVKIETIGAILASRRPEIGKSVYHFLSEVLEKGLYQGAQVKVIPKGLLGIHEGFELGRRHKVSGEKLVYIVRETPF